MDQSPESPKPLKILTIDGGGLQAIAALVMLDDLLKRIKETNGLSEKPRPCQLFDIIAGIGAGGWLALMLGRFRMDIPECLMEWNNLANYIAPHSRIREARAILKGSKLRFNNEQLIEQAKELAQLYQTGERLIEDNPPETVRSKYVFVAALRADKQDEYNLFRSYTLPPSRHNEFLPGPGNAENCEIWRAFAATGAAKYFSAPWKDHSPEFGGGERRYHDRKYPHPHNITELALNEAWSLFGIDVPMSVVVNIGPGLPSKGDLKLLSRRFTFKLSNAMRKQRYLELEATGESERTLIGTDASASFKHPEHRNTRGSLTDNTPAKRALRSEVQIEKDIQEKLSHVYPDVKSKLYYRLAPDCSPRGNFRNDTERPLASSDSVTHWLKSDGGQVKMEFATSKFQPDDLQPYIRAHPRWLEKHIQPADVPQVEIH